MANRNWENYFEAIRKEDWDQARALLNEIAKTENPNPLVYLKLGDICQRLGETSNAVRSYHVSARIQTLNGFANKALALYRIILRLDPGNTEAVSKSGELLREMENSKGTHLPEENPVSARLPEDVALPPPPVSPPPPSPAAKGSSLQEDAVIGGSGVPSLEDIFSELPEESFQKMLDDLVIPLSERQPDGSVATVFLDGMTEGEFAPILASLETRIYRHNEAVVEEGASGDTMYLVKSGSARVVAHILGREIELARLGEGDLFGEVAFLTGRPRTASVITSGSLEVYELTRFDVERMIDRDPELMSRIEDFYESRVRDTIKKVMPKQT